MELELIFICLSAFLLLCIGCFSYVLPEIFQKNQTYVIAEGALSLSKDKTNVLKGIAILGIFVSHIATHSTLDVGGYSVIIRFLYYCVVSLGDIGVAIFFSLSGYGNHISLQKKERKDYVSWMIKRLKKVIGIFILCYVITGIVKKIIFQADMSIQAHFRSLFTLTMPGTVTWYLKIQVLFYVITFISILFLDQKKAASSIFICSIVYSFLMYRFGYGVFWWHTALCYPLGYMFAVGENQVMMFVKRIPYKTVLITVILFSGFFFLCGEFIFGHIWLARLLSMALMASGILLLVYTVDSRENIFSKIAGVLGNVSYELYLVHSGFVAFCLKDGVTLLSLLELVILSAGIVGLVHKLDGKLI